jgi:hypothetical protein
MNETRRTAPVGSITLQFTVFTMFRYECANYCYLHCTYNILQQQTLNATRTEKERDVSGLDSTIKKLRAELQEFTSANAAETEVQWRVTSALKLHLLELLSLVSLSNRCK